MQQITTDLQHCNKELQSLQQKIDEISSEEHYVLEALQAISKTTQEAQTRVALEELSVKVLDIEKRMKQEGLENLSKTVEELTGLKKLLSKEVELLRNLSAHEIRESRTLSAEVVADNTEIKALALEFEEEIQVSRVVIDIALVVVIILVVIAMSLLTVAVVTPVIQAMKVAQDVAKGDLSKDIQINSNDEIGKLLIAMKDMQSELRQVIDGDVQSLVSAAQQGDLSNQINITDKQGCYKTLCSGINELVKVSEAVVEDTSRVMQALSEGNLNEKITREYRGEFNKLKISANDTVEQLKRVIEGDIQTLVG
ncbi:uncharacterized protein TRIADDRAFT_63044, partial [Trichoplax adhaerens]